MSARYIVRLDDACNTMDHQKWQLVENIFNDFNIKPIVSVVPKNLDPKLQIKKADKGFWEKVRSWEQNGWTIAMHGYTHVMRTTDSKQLCPYYKRSEFSGLPLVDQAAKIRAAWKIFESHGIIPKIWVAPAHGFDRITLTALSEETNIKIISDGIAFNPFFYDEFLWIPQQLWNFSLKIMGVWTVCLHPNQMSTIDIECLGNTVKENYLNRIIDVKDMVEKYGKRSVADHLYHHYFWTRWKLRNYL